MAIEGEAKQAVEKFQEEIGSASIQAQGAILRPSGLENTFMRKPLFLAVAALGLLTASPALANDDDHGHRGGDRRVYQDHRDHDGRGDRRHDDHRGNGDYRGHADVRGDGYQRGYAPPVRAYRNGYRDAERKDYYEDRRIYRDGYYDGRRDDRFDDRRIYRDRYYDNRRGGYYDGRRYASYAYRPYFQPFYQYDRPYYRFDQYNAAWSRPYVIGRPLPGHLRYSRIRDGYYGGLPPCPNGYYYANVGGDILLLAAATNLVVDALIFGDRY